MTTQEMAHQETRRERHWRIPPPLLADGEGPGPEGLYVLEEFQSELGAVLWRSLRAVTLWAETDPALRGHLFEPGQAEVRHSEILASVPDGETALREALEDLVPVLSRPERASPETVGVACSRIATWAKGKEAPRTALEFLQAAALACPADPRFAFAVGRAARDLASYARAEAWFYRAIGLGRQAHDWKSYVTAYLGHGKMMFRRGALPAARRSFLKALRRSRRQGIRHIEAKALHDLFVLEYRAGNAREALAYAGEAVAAHGPAHPGLPRLAHDVAYVWLEQGAYQHALPVVTETLGKVRLEERGTVLGSMARAAAGTGDEAAYAWARGRLADQRPGPGVAEAWVDTARAALVLDRHEEAEEAARLAESVARMRKEGQMRFLADSVMEEIQAELAAREAAAREAAGAETVGDPVNDRLARDLLRSLQLAPVPSEEPVVETA